MTSKIKTLKQLHLRADPYDLESDLEWYWNINHDVMRAHLSSLPHIQRVAFTGDTYEFEGDVPDSFLEAEGIQPLGYDLEELQRLEEFYHRKRTGIEATKYFDVMPHLGWLIMGQHRWEVREVILRKRLESSTQWNPSEEVVNLFLCRRLDGSA
jgi:hypothetical protein